MAEVFISYARGDAEVADRLVGALERTGLDVWIDRQGLQSGKAYDRQIEAALAAAKCVVVLWSARSIDSDWVRNEAAVAQSSGRLVPVKIEDVPQPLQFHLLQCIDLWDWAGDEAHVGFSSLLTTLRERVSGRSVPEQGAQPAVSGPGALRQAGEWAGIAFADREKERRFDQFFADRFHRQLQFALGLYLALYLILAIADVMDLYGTLSANRFRFVIATPLFAVLLGLSFLKQMQPYWRYFALVAALAAIALLIMTMRTIVFDTTYLQNGTAIALQLMLLIGAIALLPLRTPEALVAVAVPVVTGELIEELFGLNVYDRGLTTQLLICGALIGLAVAWWRERKARQWFGERPR